MRTPLGVRRSWIGLMCCCGWAMKMLQRGCCLIDGSRRDMRFLDLQPHSQISLPNSLQRLLIGSVWYRPCAPQNTEQHCSPQERCESSLINMIIHNLMTMLPFSRLVLRLCSSTFVLNRCVEHLSPVQ